MSIRSANSDEVAAFNALSDAGVREVLTSCLAVRRWVDEVAAGRPYRSPADVLRRAEESGATLKGAEVEAALARHPRIGERAGAGHDAEFSRREQSGVEKADSSVTEAIRVGNARYEAHFGRVFLIRAAGRPAPEILSELERRLHNTRDAETAEVGAQLAEIALLRLEQLIAALAGDDEVSIESRGASQ